MPFGSSDLLKAEIQSVVGITQPKLNELNGKLDACITTATVLIPQKRPDKSVQKGEADLKIDKAIFDAVTPASWLIP